MANKTDRASFDSASVEERLKDTQETLRQLDQQLENLPPDQGPTPVYAPPGFLRPRQMGNRDQQAARLKESRENVKKEAFNRIEKDTQPADAPTRRALQDRAREALFPNPYRKLSAQERQQQHGQSRDLEQAQDYMDALRLRNQAKENQPDTRDLDQSQEYMLDLLEKQRAQAEPDKAPTETPTASASLRFTQTLHAPSGPVKEGQEPAAPIKARAIDRERG
jgi:hypothetical protein